MWLTMEKDLKAQILASNAQGGGTTYTAGDGIDITGNVISIDYPTTYIEVPDATTITQELVPNVFYKFLTLTTCTTLTLTLGAGSATELNIYSGKFTTATTPPTFTAISGVTWDADGINPTSGLIANKTYEFSIVDGLGTVKEW